MRRLPALRLPRHARPGFFDIGCLGMAMIVLLAVALVLATSSGSGRPASPWQALEQAWAVCTRAALAVWAWVQGVIDQLLAAR